MLLHLYTPSSSGDILGDTHTGLGVHPVTAGERAGDAAATETCARGWGTAQPKLRWEHAASDGSPPEGG